MTHAERVAAAKAERVAMMAELDAMAAERAEARAKAAEADAEHMAAKRAAEVSAKLAKAHAETARAAKAKAMAKAAPSVAALQAKAVADSAAKAAEAKAANVAAVAAKRMAERAERAAKAKAEADAKRAEAVARATAEAKRVAALECEAARMDKANGGMWAANIGGIGSKFGESLRPVGFTAEARATMAADADMTAAAEAMGITAAEAARMWTNEKANMRQARAERTAAMFETRRANAKTRAEVLAYRDSAAYDLGAATLATLGRSVMAVVSTNVDAKRAEAVIYSAERVDAEAVAKAVAKYAKAAKAMAEAEALGDAKARAKAVASFKRAEAKAAEATADAKRWNTRPLAKLENGETIACVYVATATHRTTAAEIAEARAKMAARWDDVTAERGGRVAADTRRVVGGAPRDTTAKRAMTGAERVAKHRAEKRAAEGKAPARDYNSAALVGRSRGRAKNELSNAKRAANAAARLA
jgi:colicin import membrane protein